MHNSSVLKPTKIKAQSEAAISRLQTDNESLERANVAMEGFINDNSNRSLAFDNVRRKMEDFRTASLALIRANDADIADHRILISTVGDEEFIGSNVLGMIYTARRQISSADHRIGHYRRIRDNVTRVQRVNPFNREYSDARTNQRYWEDIRENAVELIRSLERKIERFDEIERLTSALFTRGNDLRSVAKRGLAYIQEAASGLPNFYNSAGLSAWRSDILIAKENATLHIAEQETLSAAKAFLDTIRDTGVPFPRYWTEKDKLAFAKRYLAEMYEIQWLIDNNFATTDFRVDADVARDAQETFLFLSDLTLALHLTLEQRITVRDIYLDPANRRMLGPVIEYLESLGLSDGGRGFSWLLDDIQSLALQVSNTNTAAFMGTSYHDWFSLLAAGSFLEGAVKIGKSPSFLRDLQHNWQANRVKPSVTPRTTMATPVVNQPRFPTNVSQTRHIFGNRPGHMPDTPVNRNLIQSVASNPRNFLGTDAHGTQWFAKTLPNGNQVWVRVHNNTISNAGLNTTPRPFNPTRGLNAPQQ